MKGITNYRRGILMLTLALGFLTFAQARPAHAAGVVGDGTPESCTEAAFDAALAGGGKITFHCGAAVKTITLTSLKMIKMPTTIIGKRKVILRAHNTGHFNIAYGIDFALKAITLSRGTQDGGGALFNDGQTKLVRVRFEKNRTEGWGGAIYNRGSLSVKKSSFFKNRAVRMGGAIMNDGGTLTISKTHFTKNRALPADSDPAAPLTYGGAIASQGGTVTIQSNTLSNNKAQFGGAIYGSHTVLEVATTKLTGNKAVYEGGAIYLEAGTNTFTRILLNENFATSRGGGISALGDLNLYESTVRGNKTDRHGGGIYLGLVYVDISDSTISGNRATEEGGGVWSSGRGKLTNSTLSANQSNTVGGGWYQSDGSVDLTFVTVAGNSAGEGGGVFANPQIESELWFENALLATNAGGNCSGTELYTLNHNLSSDGTCIDSFTASKDQNAVDAKLGALANNGGPTLTHRPESGSPAIDKGTNLVTKPVDQRGVARPQGASSDIGAVEVE